MEHCQVPPKAFPAMRFWCFLSFINVSHCEDAPRIWSVLTALKVCWSNTCQVPASYFPARLLQHCARTSQNCLCLASTAFPCHACSAWFACALLPCIVISKQELSMGWGFVSFSSFKNSFYSGTAKTYQRIRQQGTELSLDCPYRDQYALTQ